MEIKGIIQIMNNSWDETGFLGLIRKKGNVDFQLGNILIEDLKKFTLDDSVNLIDSELVRLLWFIPIFLTWQKDRLSLNNSEELIKQTEILFNKINNEVIRILGCP